MSQLLRFRKSLQNSKFVTCDRRPIIRRHKIFEKFQAKFEIDRSESKKTEARTFPIIFEDISNE